MTVTSRLFERAAVIAQLVDRAPQGFGRTALMKCLYFLQTLCNVPLGYNFRLYTYGPFDSSVLNDLNLAERLGAVQGDLQGFPWGHRYELEGGAKANQLIETAGEFVARYRDDIDWVTQTFGGRGARDLENASTIVFIDRAATQTGNPLSLKEVIRKVHEVKPHLPIDFIEKEAHCLKHKGLIEATL